MLYGVNQEIIEINKFVCNCTFILRVNESFIFPFKYIQDFFSQINFKNNF